MKKQYGHSDSLGQNKTIDSMTVHSHIVEVMELVSVNDGRCIKFISILMVDGLKCNSCDKEIKDSHILKVGDNYYHREHFCCNICKNLVDNQEIYFRYKKKHQA